MGAISDKELAWCRAYIRKAVDDAFLPPPLEPVTEPERAMWHLERSARLVSATGGAAGDAYRDAFGVEPSAEVMALVDREARPYFTNPYPGDNILSRASRRPIRADEAQEAVPVVDPGFRVSCGATVRQESIALSLARRAAMTPEQAADDEYCDETTKLATYTVLARSESGPGLVQRRIFGDAELDAARAEALSSPERLAYIQRRAKEIRAEREAPPKQSTPATENKPGSHAAMAAALNEVEAAIGRQLTLQERIEMLAWLGAIPATTADGDSPP